MALHTQVKIIKPEQFKMKTVLIKKKKAKQTKRSETGSNYFSYEKNSEAMFKLGVFFKLPASVLHYNPTA